MLKRFLQLCLVLFISTNVLSQGNFYKIDSNISREIDSVFKSEDNVLNDEFPKFAFNISKNFRYQKLKNNGLNLAYFLNSNDFENEKKFIKGISNCNFHKDSIILFGGIIYQSAVAFKISIFGKKFKCELILVSDTKNYSNSAIKPKLKKEVFINAVQQSLTFAKNPVFTVGTRIKGKIFLKTKEVYELNNENKLEKINPEFELLFDTIIQNEK